MCCYQYTGQFNAPLLAIRLSQKYNDIQWITTVSLKRVSKIVYDLNLVETSDVSLSKASLVDGIWYNLKWRSVQSLGGGINELTKCNCRTQGCEIWDYSSRETQKH